MQFRFASRTVQLLTIDNMKLNAFLSIASSIRLVFDRFVARLSVLCITKNFCWLRLPLKSEFTENLNEKKAFAARTDKKLCTTSLMQLNVMKRSGDSFALQAGESMRTERNCIGMNWNDNRRKNQFQFEQTTPLRSMSWKCWLFYF